MMTVLETARKRVSEATFTEVVVWSDEAELLDAPDWEEIARIAGERGLILAEDSDGDWWLEPGEPSRPVYDDDVERRIRALRRDARAEGDVVRIVLCNVALGEVDTSNPDELDENGLPDYSGGGHSQEELASIRRWLRSTPEEALAELARL